MSAHWQNERATLYCGDCLEVMRALPSSSVHAIITDPPYGIAFRGLRWDCDVPPIEVWRECLRLLKPGGHLLSFGGTRTYHRMVARIEDAGFEVRDMIAWVYATGFPKGGRVDTHIDRQLGRQRRKVPARGVGIRPTTARVYGDRPCHERVRSGEHYVDADEPISDEARRWHGWRPHLRPAIEPICLARAPLACDSLAENLIMHGVGALNIPACRVGDEALTFHRCVDGAKPFGGGAGARFEAIEVRGRYPANIIHDGSDDVGEVLGEQRRAFYCAKVDAGERGDNDHPTLKPIALMRYLVRLVTPRGGVVLDPYMGSGSTGVACMMEGMRFIGIEIDARYADTARRRIERASAQLRLFDEPPQP